MLLTTEFKNFCRLDSFEWANEDLECFNAFSCEVANYYKDNFSLNGVLTIFDNLSDDHYGYLWTNTTGINEIHDKIFDVMTEFYVSFRKKYFELFFKEYESDIDNNNPNKILKKYVSIFKPLTQNDTYTRIANADVILFRARRGYKNIKCTINGIEVDFKYPYYDSDIINPPSSLANEGRFNRDGYSYLYLSSKIISAILEVKQEVIDYCSIGVFKLKKFVNCFWFNRLPEFYNYFLKPVYDNKRHYRYTQFFSDVIYKCGLEGIQYDSVKSCISSYVIFNSKNVEFIKNSEALYKIDPSQIGCVSMLKSEFLVYKDWKKMKPFKPNERNDTKEIRHIIKHENAGVYLNSYVTPIEEAFNVLKNIDDVP